MSTDNNLAVGGPKRPLNRPFRQQALPAFKPVFSPIPFVLGFLVLGALFLIIFGLIFQQNANVVLFDARYDNNCVGTTCSASFTLAKDVPNPVFVSYRLTNFFQSHRLYIASKSFNQLHGDPVKLTDVTSCFPLRTQGGSANQSLIVFPCGLAAGTVFNDSIAFTRNANPVSQNKAATLWPVDSQRFINPVGYPNNINVEASAFSSPNGVFHAAGVQAPEFNVWMHFSPFPDVVKVYTVIEEDLKKGDVISFSITNSYPTSFFGGEKHIILSKPSVFGGPQPTIAYMFLVVGALMITIGAFFAAYHITHRNNFANARLLDWNR